MYVQDLQVKEENCTVTFGDRQQRSSGDFSCAGCTLVPTVCAGITAAIFFLTDLRQRLRRQVGAEAAAAGTRTPQARPRGRLLAAAAKGGAVE